MNHPNICCICQEPDFMPAEVKRFQLNFGADDAEAFRILARIQFAAKSIKAYLDRLPENLRRHNAQCAPASEPVAAAGLERRMKDHLYDLRKHTEILFDEARRRNADAIEKIRMPHLYI